MFSFIRNFFENRCRKAAERNRLCEELFKRVTRALLDYVDVDHRNKASVQRWLANNEGLLKELNDISKLRKAYNYSLLKYQKECFDKSRVEANITIRSLILREEQKRTNAEYVSKKLNQWTSEQKYQKVKVSSSKDLNRNLSKLSDFSGMPTFKDEGCSCCGKDGVKKRLYSSEGEALYVAELRSKIIEKPLRVYPCPYGKGFHITSNPS